jgi:transitional endoplasmic reticulum ATPase
MPALIDTIKSLVDSCHAAFKSGDVNRAVDLGQRAVDFAKGELKNPGINQAHRTYYENVIKEVGAFLKDPKPPVKPKAAGGGSDDGDSKITEHDWFSADVPNLRLKDIAGLQEVKDAFIINVFAPQLPGYSDIYSKYRGNDRGIQLLLYGPPGTGKTHTVRCLAGELGCRIAVVKVADTNQKYVGEGAKVIETVFAQAAKYDKCIIFFDEIDSIASSREGDDSRNTKEQLTTLLTLMDGFTKGVKEGQIRIVIAATNRPWALDSAVKRGGRFDTQIYIPLPDIEARRQLVKIGLGKDPSVKNRVDVPCAPDLSIDAIAERFEGYSGADIKAVCRQAIALPLKREISSFQRGAHKNDAVTMADFDTVFSKYINSITDDALMQFDAYRQNMEYDMDFVKFKLNALLLALYNKYELGNEDVTVEAFELSWFKSFYESGYVKDEFGKKYDLTFLDKIFTN